MSALAQRLYDRLQTSGGGVLASKHIESGREEIRWMSEDPVLVLDNATRYLYEISGKDQWRTGTDLPPMFPPFERVFLETKAPRRILDSKGEKPKTSEDRREPPPGVPASRWEHGIGDAIPERWGYYLECADLKSELGEGWQAGQAEEVRRRLRDEDVPRSMVPRQIVKPVRWLLKASYYIEGAAWARQLLAAQHGAGGGSTGADLPLGPLVRVVIGLDEDGELVGIPGTDDRLRLGIPLLEKSVADDFARIIGHNAVGQFNPMMLGMALMNCANVPVEKESPTARTVQKSVGIQSGRKPTSYYVLNITPMEELLRTEGRVEKVGLSRAFHLCRGHLRIYTPEGGGPFGRPIEEPVVQYVRPHARGNSSEGEVRKDYCLDSPEKEPALGSMPEAPGQPADGMTRTRVERPRWARSEKQQSSPSDSPQGSHKGDTSSGGTQRKTAAQPNGLRGRLARTLRRFGNTKTDSA